MTAAPDIEVTASGDLHRALLAVSEAVILHRELPTLFQALAGQLHQVVQFDGLALVLHEAARNAMRLHVLDASDSTAKQLARDFPIEEDPAGLGMARSATTHCVND